MNRAAVDRLGERHIGDDPVAPSARPTMPYGTVGNGGGVVDMRRTEVMECPVFPEEDLGASPPAEDAELVDETSRYPGVPHVLMGQVREHSMFPPSDDEVTPSVSEVAGQPTLRMRASGRSRASRRSQRASAREHRVVEAPVADELVDGGTPVERAMAALRRARAVVSTSVMLEVLIAVLVAAGLVLGLSALLTPASPDPSEVSDGSRPNV